MGRLKNISIIITVLALLAFAWYFVNNLQDFAILLQVPLWTLAGVALGFLISIVVNGYFVKYILAAHGKSLLTSDAINASLISAVGNFFFPVGVGSAAQAKYLKQQQGFSYTNFIASLSGNYIIVFVVNGVLGLLSLLFLYKHHQQPAYWILLVIFVAMLLPNLYFALKGLPEFFKKIDRNDVSLRARISKLISSVLGGWNFIVKTDGLVVKLTALVFGSFVASMIIGYFSILAVGVNIGFWPLVLYSALGAVTLVLNVTPGSIGIREGVFLFAMAIIGLNVTQVLAVALVERGVRFFVLLAGLAMFGKYFKQSKGKKAET